MKRMQLLLATAVMMTAMLGCTQGPAPKTARHVFPEQQMELARTHAMLAEQEDSLKKLEQEKNALRIQLEQMRKKAQQEAAHKALVAKQHQQAKAKQTKPGKPKAAKPTKSVAKATTAPAATPKTTPAATKPKKPVPKKVATPQVPKPSAGTKCYHLRIISLPTHDYYKQMSEQIVTFLKKKGIENVVALKVGKYWVVDIGPFLKLTPKTAALKEKIRKMRFQGLRQFRDAYFIPLQGSKLARRR